MSEHRGNHAMTTDSRINSTVRASTSAVILSGGQARRMGGVDKGLQLLAGRPLIAHTLARLAPQVGPIVISANRCLPEYMAFGHPVLPDALPGFIGPLAGLHAALCATGTPYLACLPCDSPYFPMDLIARLFSALTDQDAEVAVIRQGERVHPVFSLYRRSVLPQLTAYLERGERRFMTWLQEIDSVYVDLPVDTTEFANFNTLDELQRASSIST